MHSFNIKTALCLQTGKYNSMIQLKCAVPKRQIQTELHLNVKKTLLN